MADSGDKLMQMAKQIESYFTSYGEDNAVREVAAHINQFWSVKMRTDFLAHFETSSDYGPVIKRAMPLIRA